MTKQLKYGKEVSFYEASVSGDTVNAYVTALDLDVRGLESLVINILNVGANALKESRT